MGNQCYRDEGANQNQKEDNKRKRPPSIIDNTDMSPLATTANEDDFNNFANLNDNNTSRISLRPDDDGD